LERYAKVFMCGIAAVFGDPSVIRFDSAVPRLLAALRHRGPDHEEAWQADISPERRLCLLHTRLAILDLSPAGRQPMTDPETGNVIVFNGEIYNFTELRSELQKLDTSYEFRSASDTEVLLRGYAAWGADMLKRLDGMFAFALYDRRRGTLLVARDHIGIKPLYFVEMQGGWAFASEVRALMDAGCSSRQIDPAGMASFLRTGAVEEPATICRGVSAFPPGSWSEISLGASHRPVRVRYWRAENFLTARSNGHEHRALLEATVREQLVADVPVGLFLSAGVDSTVLAAMATRFEGSLQAFTIRSGEGDDDEADIAAATAHRLGIRHVIEPLAAARAEAWVLDGVTAMDQPSSDGINTYLISRVSREKGMTAVLAGTGADELHGGYPHFSNLPKWRNPIMGVLADFAIIRGLRLAKRATAAERLALIRAAAPSIGAMLAEKRRYFTPSWIAHCAPHWNGPNGGLSSSASDEPAEAKDAITVGELAGYLRNMLLRDSDWATMANAQELRVPYLGRRYMEFVLGLPWSEKARKWWGPNKPLLSQEIPKDLRAIGRRPKTGFELDYPGMLLGPHAEFFRSVVQSLNATGFALDGDRLLKELAATRSHKSARRLWSLLCLGTYIQIHRLTL
jgi:asparagine synthase (glutamine-hydrolysing)